MSKSYLYYKEKDLPKLKANLIKREQRQKDLETRGNEAISDYDLMMGYDAYFYLVTSPLVANQISHMKQQIAMLENTPHLKMF